jgi:hypothetical protein
MIELRPHENGVDWVVRASFAAKHVEARFGVFRRACDWGFDRLHELRLEAGA